MKDVAGYYKGYKGAAFVLLSAFLFGLIPILAVFAYKSRVSVMSLHFVRFTIASAALCFLLYMQREKAALQVGKRNLLKLFVLGGIMFTLTSFGYFSSIKYIPASVAALIFYSYPALVSVGSSFVNKERLSRPVILSIIISFLGLVFLSGKTAISVSMKGVLLAGLAALSYTSYILYGNFIIKDVPYQVVVAYVCFFSAISFLILGSVARGLALPNASSTWILLCFVAFVSLFGFLAFFLGVELTSPSIAAILSMAEPLVTVVLSLLIFKEYLSITQYFGGVLVLVGSFLALKASASR
jgi:drug/metabolite transporter (DMT)-like permease